MEMKMDVHFGGECHGVCVAQTPEEGRLLRKFMETVRDGVPVKLEAEKEPCGYVLLGSLNEYLEDEIVDNLDEAKSCAEWHIKHNGENEAYIYPIYAPICTASHCDEVSFS